MENGMMNLRAMVLAMGLVMAFAGCGDDPAEETATGTSEDSVAGDESTSGVEDATEETDDVQESEPDVEAPAGCEVDEDCPAPSSECAISICEQGTKTCAEKALTDGASCQVGTGSCVFVGQCDAGACVSTEGGVLGCDDGNVCTTDTCEQETGCVFQAIEGCCNVNEDCVSGDACKIGVCEEAVCSYVEAEDCCYVDEDCADDIFCTADICVPGGSCSNEQIPGCCGANDDCSDGVECTSDTCDLETGTCSSEPIEGCCQVDEDCEDGNPCTSSGCSDGTCSYTVDPFCCQEDTDCDDQLPCTSNICDPETNECTFEDQEDCCFFGNDCSDDNPCTIDNCDKPEDDEDATGTCSNELLNGCCYDMGDGVPSECDDDNPCTDDACDLELQLCEYTSNYGPDCCNEMGVCDDGNPCTYDSCDGLLCATSPVPNCCLVLDDCAPAGACETVSCSDLNICEVEAIAGCCETDGDCTEQGVCFTGTCNEGTCEYEEVDNCCDAPGTCDDGDVCTTDTCNVNENQCLFSPIVGCLECNAEGSCDDKNPCTDEVCNDLNLCDIVDNGLCPSTEPICIMSNPGGASGTCKLELIAKDSFSVAANADFYLGYDSSIGSFPGLIFGLSCLDGDGIDVCDEGLLPSGHTIAVEETEPGLLHFVIEYENASVPITTAIQTENGVEGDSKLFSLTLNLPNDVEDNSLSVYALTPKFTGGSEGLFDVILDLNTFITWVAP